MKLDKLVGERFKEKPSDCVVESHALMMTFCFAVGAIAEYEVLFPGLAGCELHHHDAVRI